LRFSARAFSVAALLLSLAACGGAGAPAGPAVALPGLSRGLPAPSALPGTAGRQAVPRTVSAASLSFDGEDYDPAIISQNVHKNGNWLSYDAVPSADPLSGSALAVYTFQTSGYSGPGDLRLVWQAGFEPAAAWIGLANYAQNRWDWFENPASGVLSFDFASGDYTDGAGQLRAAVISISGIYSMLITITLGENAPPVPLFTSDFFTCNPGDIVSIDSSNSYDIDGSIVKYEFDPEGDGSYVDKGAVSLITHKYLTSGGNMVHVRVTDNMGASADGLTSLNVSWQHSLAGAPGSHKILALSRIGVPGSAVCGQYTRIGKSDSDGLAAVYGVGGQPVWERTYGTSNGDMLSSVASDSAGNLYFAGNHASGDLAVGKLIKADLSGNLLWQKKWDAACSGAQYCQVDGQNRLYFCSKLLTGSDPSIWFIAQLSADGEVLWQKEVPVGNMLDLWACCLDDQGRLCLGGSGTGTGFDGHDSLILRFSESGALDLAKVITTPGSDGLKTLSFSEAQFYVGGSYAPDALGEYRCLAAALDENGNLLWAKTFDTGMGTEQLQGSLAMQGSGCLFTGNGYEAAGSDYDALILQFSPTGDIVLQMAFGAPGKTEYGNCIGTGGALDILLGGASEQQAGAQFRSLDLSTTDLAVTTHDLAGVAPIDSNYLFTEASAVWLDMDAAVRDTGGAMLAQYYKPLQF